MNPFRDQIKAFSNTGSFYYVLIGNEFKKVKFMEIEDSLVTINMVDATPAYNIFIHIDHIIVQTS